MTTYEVRRYKHGIAVFGPLPVGDMVALAKAWGDEGYSVIDAGISSALKANIAVTTKNGGALWRKEIEAGLSGLDEETKWLNGTDTGTSSLTIFSALSETGNVLKQRHRQDDVPYDADDLGRCIRLLERMPAWRARLGEVAQKYPRWSHIVLAWDELEALYAKKDTKTIAKRLMELRAAVAR